jgi:hypothetical protein
MYSQAHISRIAQKIIAKVCKELDIAQENDTVDELMEKYGISFEEEPMPVDSKKSKIIAYGALAGKPKDYIMAAKKLGISQENLVFISDYDELKRYDTAKLEYSLAYSDIIYGPTPHKTTKMGDENSLLAKIKQELNKYPKLKVAVANSVLKLSIQSFKNALTNTRYFKAM